MAVCFNKNTWVWQETDAPELLTPVDDWVIDPIYSPDEATCKEVGPANWIYTGNVITTKTPEEIQAANLVSIKDTMWKAIQAERDRRRISGVKVGNDWFHSDDASRIQQLGLVMFGTNMPTGIMWKTMTGAFVEMTPTLAMQIFSAVATSDTTIFAIAEQHKAAMIASQSPGTYNYLTGWPLMFGE